jgi:hypothetical protein
MFWTQSPFFDPGSSEVGGFRVLSRETVCTGIYRSNIPSTSLKWVVDCPHQNVSSRDTRATRNRAANLMLH